MYYEPWIYAIRELGPFYYRIPGVHIKILSKSHGVIYAPFLANGLQAILEI